MDKIKQLISANSHQVSGSLPQHYLPSLKVTLNDRADLNFNQEDLVSTFSMFGEVASVQVRDDHAIVNFHDITAAFFAQKCLNNEEINSIGTTLCVEWRTKKTWTKPFMRRNC